MLTHGTRPPRWSMTWRSSWSFHFNSIDVSTYLSISQPQIYFPHRLYISPHSTTLTINFGLHHQFNPTNFLIFQSIKSRDRPRPRPLASARLGTHRLLAPVGTFSIFLTTNIPSTTLPKTQCLPSRNSAGAHVMKNYL
jgi:hypothetical protein